MALKGNLRDFSLTQLLNLINLSKKTGMLVIEAAGERAQIAFSDGKLVYANLGQENTRLPAILRKTNYITNAQYRVLAERTSVMTDKEVGLLLINAGYGTQEGILAQVQTFYVENVQRIFTWLEGVFNFETNSLPEDEKITIRLELEDLIIEGSRHIREWEQLQEELPDLDVSLKFSERPNANIRNINLSVEEWRVVSFVNPKNTIHQIANAVQMNELEIRRVVLGLMRAGMVEIVQPEVPALLHERMFPTKDRQEQRSLVNRIIDRIRSI